MRFSDIVGQERPIEILRQLADSDRIPHALMISGPAGSGKMMLAQAFAQYIHCQHRTNGDSCGECPSCRQHQSLNNPDMFYVFPVCKNAKQKLSVSDDYMERWREFLPKNPYAPYEGWLQTMEAGNSQPQIYVDESNIILHKMNLSNFSAKYKIMLIWLPEKLQENAANKLLKIIEEPFGDTRFILVSNSPQSVLPTIFSRTQRINVPPLHPEEISRFLIDSKGIDDSLAHNIAELAEGNMNKALKAIDISDEAREFCESFQEIMRKAYTRDVRSLKDWSENHASDGREKLRRFFEYCSRMIRENFIYNIGNRQLLMLNPEEERFSRNFAPFIHSGNVAEIISEIDCAAADIAGNGNAKIILFDFLIQLIILIKKPKI